MAEPTSCCTVPRGYCAGVDTLFNLAAVHVINVAWRRPDPCAEHAVADPLLGLLGQDPKDDDICEGIRNQAHLHPSRTRSDADVALFVCISYEQVTRRASKLALELHLRARG